MRKFDLIISCGANCSAAHNILIRDKRPCSLPFDWTYMKEAQSVKYFAHGIETGFQDFCLKENLVEMVPSGGEYAEKHADRRQFVDMLSGYRFVNHFKLTDDFESEYQRVYKMLSKRIHRLHDCFCAGSRFLFLLATDIKVSVDTIKEVLDAASRRYPLKEFEFEYLRFGCQNEFVKKDGHITLRGVSREQNEYDFYRTNWEWNFLDEIEVDSLSIDGIIKRTSIAKDRKISFRIWPKVNCVISVEHIRKV